jgi:hypothetical protein
VCGLKAAVAAGLKEGHTGETIEELEGILTYKGKERMVSIRQGVLMIYSLNGDGKVPVTKPTGDVHPHRVPAHASDG